MAQEETEMQSILDQSCLLDGVRLAELIGSGSYAKVYRGRWKGIPVAVKQLHAIFSESGSSQREGLMHTFYKELGMNIKLRHPNIIQFLGVVLPRTDAATNGEGGARMAAGGGTPGRRGPGGGVEEFPMMVMELMHCTLEKRLSEYRSASTRMPLCESVDIAADIAAALVYLHGKEPRPIAHRDLAPKNVLLSPEGTAKLCDLGVAKWANSSRNNTQGPGTLPYMPPEVRISTHYLPVAVDTYSFGVTVLEMCSGLEPKPKDFAQMMPVDGTYQYQLVPDKIRREKSLSALQPNHPLETTIEQCLQTNADKRPTAEQLLYTMQSMKESKVYLESKKIVKTETCSSCKAKDEELSLIKEQLVERSRELLRLVEENKILKRLRDEQLQSLQVKLETTAEEGERYQQKIQEMQGMLQEQVKMNRGLEMSHDREKDINQLLMQKVEMDNNPSRFSHPPPHRSEKSMSVTCIDDQRPKPVPKPRKRRSDVAVRREQLNDAAENSFHSHADNLLKPGRLSSAISGSVPSLPKISPDLTGSGDNTYLQLDAVAMAGAQRARGRENSYVNVKRPHPLQTRKSNPMLLSENEEHRPAPLWSARSMLDFHTKADATFKISQPQPIPNGKSTTSENGHPIRRQSSRHLSISPPSSESNEIQDEHIYVEIPASGPPTPPPRDEISFQFHRGTTQSASWNSPRPTRLSIIDEKEESLKSPQLKTPGEWPDRMARSMRDKKTPLKEDPQNLAPPRPSFGRQSSRGDVLISRVQSSVKAKNSSELTAVKGELVKVTNTALDKKLCIAVTTTGQYGTMKKRNLERIEPVEISYDPANPALSRRKGVISHIARCSSHNNVWISPVESNRITITPSSLHSGDVSLLIKMTDYLLCCTDDEEESHFEIDLREKRMLKLSGYVLQCHSGENNGAPLQWRLEGSHNGNTWNSLSEEFGNFFRKRSVSYFRVTNPAPCRYFRLTQLSKNTAGNFRFCLSGIELYGYLYSSITEERSIRRVF